MIASRLDRALALAALLLAASALTACLAPAGTPGGELLDRDLYFSALVPDVADYTARDLAAGALASQPEQTALALQRLENIETVLAAAEEPPTGLLDLGHDVVNAMHDDVRAYRTSTRDLLDEEHVDDAQRARLEQAEHDDPLRLANDRIRDSHVITYGRAFNALVEPVGRSIMSTSLAPYRLAHSLLRYAIEVNKDEALPLQRRQALAHWKTFLAKHPDAPEAEELVPRVEEAQALWNETQRNRSMKSAKRALDKNRVRLALIHSDRALRYMPEDREAFELREEAAARLVELR